MKSHSQEFIAGWKTVDDWKLTRSILENTTDPTIWGAAFDDYFETRMELRYLNPIRVLQENGTFQGEGFSIAAIQCSIIEFLESTWQGLSYKYRNPGAFEYAESGKIFKDFLTKRDPFKAEFTDDIATDFYVSVRCGLLHEARTKNGWVIRAHSETGIIIDPNNKILFRDNFQKALLHFINIFRNNIQHDVNLQKAFIRKFDILCE